MACLQAIRLFLSGQPSAPDRLVQPPLITPADGRFPRGTPRGAWRLARTLLALALIAAGLAVSAGAMAQPGPAAAAEPEKVNSAQPAWTVTCFSRSRAAPPDCRIEQRLFVKQTGRVLSVAVINVPGRTRKPELVMQLPNGLALQAGVSPSIDGGPATPLALQTCDNTGRYATLALTHALIEAMEKGKVMAIKATAANHQPLVFEHLLTDVRVAYEAAK